MTLFIDHLTSEAFCVQCQRNTPHRHLHDTAYGMPETHMEGSERYVCVVCDNSIHAWDCDEKNENLRFLFDSILDRKK